MTSTPPSHSEGEIFTSDSEKAPQTLHVQNGTSVDRRTRKNISSLRNPRSRSRSRSPYRVLRGEKRRLDERNADSQGGSDPRLQKVRNTSDRYSFDRSGGRRPRFESNLSYAARGHDASDYHKDGARSFKRPRTSSRSRSRSPFRHSQPERKPGRGPQRDHNKPEAPEEEAQVSGNGSRLSDEQSVSERSKPSAVAHTSKSIAKPSKPQSSHAQSKHAPNLSADKYVSKDSCHYDTEPCISFKAFISTVDEPETAELSGVVDEAALIEARRKRREALKAKYRSQETPLLVQALHLGTDVDSSASSSAQTPLAVEQPVVAEILSSKTRSSYVEVTEPISPQTPKEPFHSPAEINFEQGENLANSSSGLMHGDEDEPLAADYDPTVDMQEERARHDKRLSNMTISMSADAERNVSKQDESGPTKSQAISEDQPVELVKQKDAFDMFAEEDDEDDMFTEAPSKPAKSAVNNDPKAAQALDVKMMDNWDDPEGYYMTIPGELFESRYHVLQNLGRGMFSSVVRATDTTTNKLVAIKIVRNNDTMRKAGIKEIEILKDLAANDPEDKKHIIRLERSFEHKGHLCMVFENLSLNLREVLKKFGRDVGINLKAIRAYAQQLFLGLSLLRKCQFLHADLKPDNILVNEARNVLKICDLGSASSIVENATAPYLVSRFYRAPEIILGIPYDYGIDVWSVGCTLFELYTGKILFTGRNNNAMLRSIMECRGKFPNKVLRKGSLSFQYFDDLLNFQSIDEDKLTGRTVTKMMDIKAKPVRGLRERLVPKDKRMDEVERKEVELFADLLDKCLDLRGDKRITPPEALRHSFITRAKG
jgi:serine/threonine-protein kinase PRP4